MEVIYTKEQRERLKPYESHLITAYRSGYVRGLSNYALDEMLAVHREAFGEDYRLIRDCATCLFDFILKMAKPYYKEPAAAAAKKKGNAKSAARKN